MTNIEYAKAPLNGSSRPEPRDKMQAMMRGAREKCPNCGDGSVFSKYLKVADSCKTCGEELHHERSDDAAPYFTIFIVGHIMIPLVVFLETQFSPSYWAYAMILIPLLAALTLLILPRVKGVLIGLQWALYMHGFDQDEQNTASPLLNEEIIGQKQ